MPSSKGVSAGPMMTAFLWNRLAFRTKGISLRTHRHKERDQRCLEEQRDEGGKKDGRKRTMSLRFHLRDLH